jgi:hypothetical protein
VQTKVHCGEVVFVDVKVVEVVVVGAGVTVVRRRVQLVVVSVEVVIDVVLVDVIVKVVVVVVYGIVRSRSVMP